jgi:predicted PurR-regulated permease PerM
MINGKNFQNGIILLLVVVLFLLAALIIKPLIYSLISAILLAYIFYPVYKWILKRVRYENLAAIIVCLLLLLIVLAPMVFILTSLIHQVINVYLTLQTINFQDFFAANIAPSSELTKIIGSYLNDSIPKLIGFFISKLSDFVLDLPAILIQIFVALFVFFFCLRDGKKALENIKSISPFSKEVEDKFFRKFKDITNSVLLGQLVVGIVQGLAAGIGYFIFGVHNALFLTLLTVLVAIIPFIGAWLVWVPVDIYLFIIGDKGAGIGLLIYGLFIVSWIDNIVRPLIVSKRADMNSAIVIVGMLGGLFAFGILGLIIGPLILGYILLVLEIYKKRSGDNSFFKEVKEDPVIKI